MNLAGPMYRLYEYLLHRQLDKEHAPNHVGIILDGNRRWAREHGLDSPWFGHQKGAKKVMDVMRILWEAGVKVCTLYAFSVENFERHNDEVSEVMKIAEEKREESVDLWEFTNVINQNFSREDKIKIMESAWKVIYADEKLDKYEDRLVKVIGGMLNVDHKDIINAKMFIKEQLKL